MTNAEKFVEVFGTDLKRQYATKSWWNQEFVPPKKSEEVTCKDTISRQEAIDAFSMFAEYESNRTNAEWVDRIRVVLSSLPPVTPKQRIGHWIIISPTDMYCSECNEIEHLDTRRRFCAFCGAEMVEPHESEDKNEK